MAIDPRLILRAGQAPDIGRTFSDILTNVGRIQNIQQQGAEAPFREQLLKQQVAGGERQALGEREQQRIRSLSVFGSQVSPMLEAGDIEGAKSTARQRIAQLQQQGIDTSDTEEFLQLLDTNPQLAQQRAGQAAQLGQIAGVGAPRGVQSSQFIPGVGFATLSKTGEARLVPVEGVGETAEEKRELDLAKSARLERQKTLLKGKDAAVKAAVTRGGKAFDQIAPLTKAISNYDEAIEAIDQGAETGVVESFLPSFKEASIKLDNVVKRLGLDVVGQTTFGALSEKELGFALEAAIPTTLQPAELREWLTAKKAAQQKVKARVEEAASFLSDGTHTIKDWIEFDKAKQLNQQNHPQPVQQDFSGFKIIGIE